MSDKPVAHDAEAWTGHLPTDWPRAIDHPEPRPVLVKESLSKSLLVACVLLLSGALPWLPISEKKRSPKDMGHAAALLLGGLWMVRRSYRINRQPGTVLTLDERGLTWPGGYAQTIPWGEITSARLNRVFFPTPWLPGVYLRVRSSLKYGPRVLGWPMIGAAEGLEGLRPLPWLLDAKPGLIFVTIQSYRAHYGRRTVAG